MPRKSRDALTAVCADCGGSFQTTRSDARFCPGPIVNGRRKASPCQVRFGNRMAIRGKVVMPYVMAWIEGRGGGNTPAHPVAGKAMRELTTIVRDFIDEDRAANDGRGRIASTDYAESLFASGYLYIDRKRRPGARRRIAASQTARLAPLKAG